ncbi:UPF0669 protein C6orf120 homolog isoform X2 [Ctenocephalides felis]|uniref:UPF0669 protein C6orf120 homolog n=1 Tax=Ctenocephalides felis TaxID=7515 RepID=UPI000E6E3D50|nr:UPF0669 protein C6orf120 homolog [Ctenocephalides felis]XP_026477995.1 UPF0669 protein C6orf120 homolog isoform X2 [Ctenocephalides felis]
MDGCNVILLIAVVFFGIIYKNINFDSTVNLNEHFTLLNSVTYQIGSKNYSYWSLSYQGTILIKLFSISGDCDLYISKNGLKPLVDPLRYDLHSATCGVDEVLVPHSFKRPISIGVYGYSASEKNLCQLDIYKPIAEVDVISDYLKLNGEYVNFELLQQDHEYAKENRINLDIENSRNRNNSPILKIIVQSILSTSFVIDAFLETFLILI